MVPHVAGRRPPVNAPNTISILRLLAVPAVVWLILEDYGAWAFWLFIVASASDAVDGFVAKQFGLTTDLGRYLDPIADKTLLAAVYVTLGQAGILPSWLVILVVTRDVLIIGGAMLAQTRGHSMQIQPILLSKVNTGAQMLLAALVLGGVAYVALANVTSMWITPLLIWATAATTVASGIAYLGRWSLAAPEDR